MTCTNKTKQCKRCKEIFTYDKFYMHRGRPRPQCAVCYNYLNRFVWKSTREDLRAQHRLNRKKKTIEEQREKERARRRVANRGPEYAAAQKAWREKYYSDPQKNLARAVRRRLYMARKVECKTGKTLEYLGCSWQELKQHLESQFKLGMTWDNYGQGGWHIDHIKPLCAFDLTKEEHLKIVCHYTNLRPLWQHENIAKIQEDLTYKPEKVKADRACR